MAEEEIRKALNSKVKDCMRSPLTVPSSEHVSSLMANMIDNDVGAVIIVEENKPIGIITEKDVLERVVRKDKDAYSVTAGEIMSKPIISIESNRSIKEALDLMQKHNIRRLAITENNALIGLVTERRLLAKFLNDIM